MRTRAGVALLAVVICGCPLFKPKASKDDAGAAAVTVPSANVAAASATASVAAPASASTASGSANVAANAADIAHFPGEKKIADEKATIQWNGAKVRKKPQGDQVAVLKKGTSVTKQAEHMGFFLITFADPNDGSRQLMGWVYKDAFTGAESGPIVAVLPGDKCPAGYALVNEPATGKECRRSCTTNAQCGSKDYVCYSGHCTSAHGE